MKKRGKTIKKSQVRAKKKITIPVLLFVLVLVFIVYTGIMGVIDKATTSLTANQMANSGDLASYSSPSNIILAVLIIIIFFAVVIIFLNIKVKKKKKRR